MDGFALMDDTRVCGPLLAKGHARSADPAILTGYLGNGHAVTAPLRASPVAMSARPSRQSRTLTGNQVRSSPGQTYCVISAGTGEARWNQSSKLPYEP
jgi:hypothetical protein